VTDLLWDESEPVFSADGNYLYYLSEREFAPQLSSYEWNFATNRTTALFALALRKDVPHPFPPESDEVTLEGAKPAEKAADEKEKAKGQGQGRAAQPIQIDFDGLASASRACRSRPTTTAGSRPSPAACCSRARRRLLRARSRALDRARLLRPPEAQGHHARSDVNGYALSNDGKKLLVSAKEYQLMDAGAAGKEGARPWPPASSSSISCRPTSGARSSRGLAALPRLLLRANMHGYDWGALRRQYEALLPFVAHRSDLDYVHGRDGGRAQRGPRLHRRRRLEAARARAGRPAGRLFAVDRAADRTASRASWRATTTRSATARR
jgi:tricorn protease